MGLTIIIEDGDYLTGSWSMSYGGFHELRERVAELHGIDLDEMWGFGGQKSWDDADPITPFLNHNDCDGELSPEECRRVAPVLLADAAKLDEHYAAYAARLAALMERAAKTEKRLLFR